MRALIMLGASLVACLPADKAAAQTPAPPVPIVGAAPAGQDVLTWDELPPAIRSRATSLIEQTPPQAVLHVENAVVPDTEFRPVDHGDILFEQVIRPAGLARMVRPVRNAEKYGPQGSLLWPAVGPDGDYWCWRRLNPANDRARGNFYCYADSDRDGTSERLMENNTWMGSLASSRFQFLGLGHDEGVEETATFEVEPGGVGEFKEVVILRYYGASRGLVQPDGSLGPGVVEFELLTGPDRHSLGEVKRISIEIDARGRGEYHALNGVELLVDGVSVDGTARVKLLGGLPEGRALLNPALTRELVVERMREFYNPDGSPRRPTPLGDKAAGSAD